MARSELVVNDKKWREIRKRIPAIEGAAVTVGVQSDAGAGQDGTPIAAYAAFNEFGTRGGGWGGPIPARSFIGSTADERKRAWSKAAETAIDRALTLTATLKNGLGVLGTIAQQDIQQKITSISTPPNSETTIALKGSSNPLINTGAMRQAIRYEVQI